jgi:hypothetical protein
VGRLGLRLDLSAEAAEVCGTFSDSLTRPGASGEQQTLARFDQRGRDLVSNRETIARQTICQWLGRPRVLFALTLVALAGLALLLPGRASAGTRIRVNCTANPGALASALASASDGDTLAIRGTCTGTFEIAHSLTLAGAGAATLDGQAAGTVLTVDSGKTVVIKNLIVRGGSASGVFAETVAGGISNLGTLTLRNSSVNANTADGDGGTGVGGILNGGTLTLWNSSVNGNSAGAETAVGGILNTGTVALKNSEVSGNSAGAGMGGNAYAGILNTGTLTLGNSSVDGNSTTGDQAHAVGGISSSSGKVSLRNSSVSGNSASAPSTLGFAVGGILNDGGMLTLRNSAVSGNSASSGGPAVGGILNAGTLTVRNSRVSGNHAAAFFEAVGGISNSGMLTVRNSRVSENRATAGFEAVGGISNFFSGTVTLRNSRVENNIPNNCNFIDPACA